MGLSVVVRRCWTMLHPSSGDRRRRQHGRRSSLPSHGRPLWSQLRWRVGARAGAAAGGWHARPLAAGRQPQVLVGVLATWAARVVMDRTRLPPSVGDDRGGVTGKPGPELVWTKLVAPALRPGLVPRAGLQ